MSSPRLISIQGTDHSLSSSNIAGDTSVYIVNRLAAKAGATYSGYKLHYLIDGIWLKCDHSSPLKKYQKCELEFRLPYKPSVFVKKPKVVETVYRPSKSGYRPYYYSIWTPIRITHDMDDKTPFKRYYRLGSSYAPDDDDSDASSSDIENTGVMDKEDQEKAEAVKVRNMYIAAQKASNGKRKEVKSLRQGLKLTQSDIDALLDGEDFY
ncbi:hypothetical protein LPJ53_006348 [Coemansia erecta]|uniref:Uncharacterized protein n=1 Tax=Coemansia erecta TaxID=147472 RepID=A0A9W7XSW7_9FUNG|nr:hypothetical protein LPJ53_006348 [Coemansia erecta]